MSSVPLWMALFAALRGGTAAPAEWIGLGVGTLGVAWLSGRRLAATPVGWVALLVATIAWATDRSEPPRRRSRSWPRPRMLCSGAAMVVARLAIGERIGGFAHGGLALLPGQLQVAGGFSASSGCARAPGLAGYAYVNP